MGASSTLDGRLPGITRCGISSGEVPSASTSCPYLPNASARGWARKFAENRSCIWPRSWLGSVNPMKSAGTSRVPWCSSW